MPTALHLIRPSEFVCLDADKHPDMEATTRALQDLAYACRKRGVERAMMDLRELVMSSRPYFTPRQLAELVETFLDAGFTKKQRLAILYQKDPHGGVRNFTFFSRMHGMQVQAFQEFERAIYWLSGEQDALASSPPGTPIPVRKGKTKKETRHATRFTRVDLQPLSKSKRHL